MHIKRKLPDREKVFISSLLCHGFILVYNSRNLRRRSGYIIPSTKHEDASGVDFWIKMPGETRVFPIQITQRGVRMYRKYQELARGPVENFVRQAQQRLRRKTRRCKANGVFLVLVSDFDGPRTNSRIAWCDIKALRYAMETKRR